MTALFYITTVLENIMPVAEITTLVTSVKASVDIAKGIGSLKAEVERNQAVSELLQSLLSVQSDALAMQAEHFALLQEKERPTKRVAQFEKWSETEQGYELHQPNPGVFVYAPRKINDISKMPSWLCTLCFEDHIKSILQCKYDNANSAYYFCPRCKTVLQWHKHGAHKEEPPPGIVW